MVYRKRSDLPYQPGPIVAALRNARDAMIRCQMGVKISGPAYQAASAVVAAIDTLATLLTGDPRYFSAEAHGGGNGPLGTHCDKLARERGEATWKRCD